MRLRDRLPKTSTLIAYGLATLLFLVVFIGAGISACSGTGDVAKRQADSLTPSDESQQATVADSENGNYINLQQTPDSSFLYDIAISDLCSAEVSFQKKTVQVKGEVVGHALRAEQDPGMYWITLKSEPGQKEGSLSVLVNENQLGAIDSYGKYSNRGTILSVKGTFYVACTSHEGVMDIHADTVSAVEAGYAMPDEFDIVDFVPGVILCAIAIALLVVYRSFAEGER